ncbi:hypothetical protein J2X69_002731 [Algoriphagus sp. 4150]|uniref:hypothetical protein n=1 Tax=Algoriphagus sp. 4150 TaxID=2817756 RepID=UPI0028658148|nr:hypothetical protein [Algoriphagus sp. 4150]MDR7130381.1 hypothetical protein [Algoriphagus sp. 4150]
MEIVASFILMLLVYFLGCLALVQEIIRPNRKLVIEGDNKKAQWVTNYPKIISLSFGISLLTTFIAYYLFLS